VAKVIVSIRDLEYTYLPGTPLASVALRGASLLIRQGEIAALVGPSGAGKSTLVHFINGLLRPQRRGQVLVLGQDLGAPDCDLTSLRRQVGLVFQFPHQQFLERYVGDDIAYGPRQMGLPLAQVRERVRWAMELVGLDFEAFVDRPTFSLSGGEMRRVALAGVLALRPQLLILDEATAGLDPQGRRQIHQVLRRLRDEEGTSILLVSNDMDEVVELADTVTVLQDGRTMLAGPLKEVFSHPQDLSRCGLGYPAGYQIVQEFAQRGIDLPGAPLRLAEVEEAIWRALSS